jgi:hypothetical protein
MTTQTVMLLLLCLVLAVLWLAALLLSSFNILVVSAGLLVALLLNPRRSRAHR